MNEEIETTKLVCVVALWVTVMTVLIPSLFYIDRYMKYTYPLDPVGNPIKCEVDHGHR